jgi:hypothetical protein
MAITKQVNTEGTTRAYNINFKSRTEPMTISYTNDILGFKGTESIDAVRILEAISEEELATLQDILQKLADGFNPDR